MAEKKYPVHAKDYKLYEEIGEGVSASVYRALCIPFNEIVAIKVLDLERCNNDLGGIHREVRTMSLIHHPHLLRSHCSFSSGHNLWVVMPYMAAGSCLHIMKSSYPEGFEEPVIATLLCDTLKALVYLHSNGHIHRDVKAGNILLDSDGSIKLADFGVSACMFDTGDRQRSRNTFVGTPCWMAPEVMQQLNGYDFKADIWSFGITALELAHGHAPFSKYPPMKVLLMTLQNAPPGLDYERDKRFSKSFKELVAACLVKDPKKRPTSEKLMKHPFFKNSRSNVYLARTILDGLPPLGERFKYLKAKEAEVLAQNKYLHGDKEQMSQQEYKRGISEWNFNLEDLKSQAALIPDDESASSAENSDASLWQKEETAASERPSPDRTKHMEACDEDDLDSLERSLDSFPIQPLQALKGYFDVGEDDVSARNSTSKNAIPSGAEKQTSPKIYNQPTRKVNGENISRSSSVPQFPYVGQKKVSSGPLVSDHSSFYRKQADGDRDQQTRYSGPVYFQKKDANSHVSEDPSEGAVVQRKGRFKVTSADMSPKGSTNGCFTAVPGTSAGTAAANVSVASVLPSLQFILQHNSLQREEIMKLIKLVEQASGNAVESGDAANYDFSQVTAASAREEELLAQVLYLEQSVGGLEEELQRQKLQNAMLERQLNAALDKKGENVGE